MYKKRLDDALQAAKAIQQGNGKRKQNFIRKNLNVVVV